MSKKKQTKVFDGEQILYESRYGNFDKDAPSNRFNAKVITNRAKGVFVPEVAFVNEL